MKIGNIDVVKANDLSVQRLSAIIWGMSGSGKTTLAATAPGRKLLINLDPDGATSISFRDDVDVLDLSSLPTDQVITRLKSADNPLNLSEVLKDGTYETLIFDSATSLSQRALEQAVQLGLGKSGRFTPTMETPGLAAYGGRNAILLTVIKGLLRVTGRYGVHCIITSHEDEPKINEGGEILYITMMLGGKLVQQAALQISEVWWLREDKGKHFIAIRPCRQRKPMKTRMFVTDANPEFSFEYDPESDNPISDWWTQWKKSGGEKLSLPK